LDHSLAILVLLTSFTGFTFGIKPLLLPLLERLEEPDLELIDKEEISIDESNEDVCFANIMEASIFKMEEHLKKQFFKFAGEEPQNAQAIVDEWMIDESDPKLQEFAFLEFLGDNDIDR
jgi:flagellar biosynthesis/type III secretory pathway M-ring protein FliF/YscJ